MCPKLEVERVQSHQTVHEFVGLRMLDVMQLNLHQPNQHQFDQNQPPQFDE